MNKTNSKKINEIDDDLEEHYDFDYSNAKPNRFAPILAEQSGFIKLQPDIQEVFKTSEQVNSILRAIITAYPKSKKAPIKPV